MNYLHIYITLFSIGLFAQDSVNGIVYDNETRQPILGVNIINNTNGDGQISDNEGKFVLSNVNKGGIYTFSYIGYKSKSITISNQDFIEVYLVAESDILDEIVVVGYGSQKKSNVVGSVVSVEVDKANQIPTTNVTELLRGRAAGVQVNLGDPRPGGTSSIIIRGNVSVAGGNNPLIIVDGLPFDNLNDISPDDIQSIEILKDAASTAIYGARASNGVVLVTTKRARKGYTSFNYAGYVTTQTLTKNFDMYNPVGFFNYKMDAWRARTGLAKPPSKFVWEEFELQLIENQNFVDWEDLALRDALLTNHSISYSSGAEKSSIYSSLNYFSQDGIIPNSAFNRLQFKLNYSHQLSDRISLDGIINIQNALQKFETGGIFLSSLSPIAKPFDENGNLVKYFLGQENSVAINPLWDQNESKNQSEINLSDISLKINYEFNPKLSYSLKTFFRNRNTDQGIYRSSFTLLVMREIMVLEF